MGALFDLFRDAFVKHTWSPVESEGRKCSVCERVEQYDDLASVNFDVWLVVEKGRPEAHRAAQD